MKKLLLTLTVFFVLLPVVFVSAQSSGEAPPPSETPQSTPTETPGSAGGAAGTPTPTPTPATVSSTPAVIRTQTPLTNPPPTTQPSSTPTPTPSISPTPTPPEDNGASSWPILSAIGIALAGIGTFGMLKLKKSKQPNAKDDGRCDGIKDLLEQKKKELKESIQNWPEEKLKNMVKDQVIGELKKDENTKKIIEAVESIKAKQEKLKKTIEMLEKRYDLCMLSFPEKGEAPYKGTIIENSLTDKVILENLEITKKYQLEDWLLHDVVVNEKQIGKLGEFLNDGPWYTHFWKEGQDDVIVVFKGKSFKIKYSDKNTWKEAVEYGKSKGIPEEQLDFRVK